MGEMGSETGWDEKRAGRSGKHRNRGVPATSLGGSRGSQSFTNLLTASFPAGPGLAARHGLRPAGQGQAAVWTTRSLKAGAQRRRRRQVHRSTCPPFRWTGTWPALQGAPFLVSEGCCKARILLRSPRRLQGPSSYPEAVLRSSGAQSHPDRALEGRHPRCPAFSSGACGCPSMPCWGVVEVPDVPRGSRGCWGRAASPRSWLTHADVSLCDVINGKGRFCF